MKLASHTVRKSPSKERPPCPATAVPTEAAKALLVGRGVLGHVELVELRFWLFLASCDVINIYKAVENGYCDKNKVLLLFCPLIFRLYT